MNYSLPGLPYASSYGLVPTDTRRPLFCPYCGASIGLSPESCPVVSKAVEKPDKVKSQPHRDD